MSLPTSRLKRLVSADQASVTVSDETWSLDALGNMTLVTGDSPDYRAYNDQNELTGSGDGPSADTNSFDYDDAGNLLNDTQGNHFTYDAWNRLVAVTDSAGSIVVAFQYDGLGRRTRELHFSPSGTDPHDLYYSSSWQILDETAKDSSGSTYYYTRNVWSPVYVNALVLRDRDTDANHSFDERLYYTTDANYDVTSAITATSYGAYSVQQRIDYTSGGVVTFYTGTWSATTDSLDERQLYQGTHYNVWFNSYDMENRIYLPELMRWMTNDPMGYVNGVLMYQMVGGNPINSTDPSGLWAVDPSDSDYVISNDKGDTLSGLSQQLFGKASQYGLFGYQGNPNVVVLGKSRVNISAFRAMQGQAASRVIGLTKNIEQLMLKLDANACSTDTAAKGLLEKMSDKFQTFGGIPSTLASLYSSATAAKYLPELTVPWNIAKIVDSGQAAAYASKIGWIKFAGRLGTTLTVLGLGLEAVTTVTSGDYSATILGGHAASMTLATYSLFAGPFAPLAGAAAAVGNLAGWGIEAWANHGYQAEVEINREIVVKSTMQRIPQLMQELDAAYGQMMSLNARLP